MRKQFAKTTEELVKKNKKLILLLGDISVFNFRHLLKKYPLRAINIGILEQATISFAAGLSKIGFTPIVHTIAPFIAARAFEQLKIDFGYQKLAGNFITIGSSYDYAALGCTHHAPEDVNLMKNIPGMQIIVPGCSDEFDQLFKQSFNNNSANYYRLSECENKKNYSVKFGKANILQTGDKATIITFGPVLNYIEEFIGKYDVNLLYYTTIRPFDKKIFKKINKKSGKFLIIEPFYSGTVHTEIHQALKKKCLIESISIPYKFLNKYGSRNDHDISLGFTSKNIEKKIKKLIELKC
jgi:transketolase